MDPKTILPLLVAFLMAVPAVAQDREVLWTARAENSAQAQTAQQELLLTLFNTGRLPFREVPMAGRKTLEQVMREEGAWVGPMTEQVAAMLCEVNPTACSSQTRQAGEELLDEQDTHVGGTVAIQQSWTVHAEQKVMIPDVKIVQTSKPEPAKEGDKVEYEGIQIVRACLTNKLCIDDYKPAGESDDRLGRLRDVVVAKTDLSGKGLALRLVPQLNAALEVNDEPLPNYDTLNAKRSRQFDFNDKGFEKFNKTLLKDIVGGMRLQLEGHGTPHVSFAGMLQEPLADRQKALIDNLCNLKMHVRCPEISSIGMEFMSVAVVDQVPDVTHCDFGNNINVMISDDMPLAPAPPPPLTPASAPGAAAPAAVPAAAPTCDKVLQAHQVLPEFHGTHVLGMLAAEPNGRGVAGLLSGVPSISFVVIPFNEVDGTLTDPVRNIQLANAIDRAVSLGSVRVFNFSWSYRPDEDGSKDVVHEAIKTWAKKAIFVVAAGKHGQNADDGPCSAYPACYAASLGNVVSVVALEDGDDKITLLHDDGNPDQKLTNFGHSVFGIGAPGRDIVSTVGHDAFGPATGTSQAAPQVTAVAAILMAREDFSPPEVRDRLIYTARMSTDASAVLFGGALDVTAALSLSHDLVRLNNGCLLSGKVRSLTRDDGGNWEEGSFDIRPLDSGLKLSISLSFMRRIHWEDSKGLFFFQDGDRIEREVAAFATNPNQHMLKMDVTAASGACDPGIAATGDIVLSTVAEFIARKR